MYSKMITKLCNNENRTTMICNVIHFELKKNPNQQIMILAHNKSLIQALYDNITHFEESVGFYLGGMKEDKLKASESKKIIIATYAMASEGLDIKTLTTLCRATPKSDVCQCIGRILRSKHSNPYVIDIMDSHDIFKKQYMKRKQYYFKKNYVIHKFLNYDNYVKNEYNEETKQKKSERPKKSTCLIKIPDNVS